MIQAGMLARVKQKLRRDQSAAKSEDSMSPLPPTPLASFHHHPKICDGISPKIREILRA